MACCVVVVSAGALRETSVVNGDGRLRLARLSHRSLSSALAEAVCGSERNNPNRPSDNSVTATIPIPISLRTDPRLGPIGRSRSRPRKHRRTQRPCFVLHGEFVVKIDCL